MDTPANLPIERHAIFQYSLMTALLDGIYDGEMTISELLGHGNFGLGTFDALDGEMVVLDGVCWRLRGDGTAERADLRHHTPFAVVTNFVPRITATAPSTMHRSDLSDFISGLLPSENFMYAVRITGEFSSVTVRTVTKQSKPYRPMMEANTDSPELTISHTRGVVAGFRTPVYESGISVPGCHVHYINDERTTGGHILDFTLTSGVVEICPATDLNLRLPTTMDFGGAELDREGAREEIDAIEK